MDSHSNSLAQYQELKKRHETLARNRIRYETELDAAVKEEKRLAQEALDRFGAASIEDLERIIREAEENFQRNMETVRLALEEEERIQQEIKAKLMEIQ